MARIDELAESFATSLEKSNQPYREMYRHLLETLNSFASYLDVPVEGLRLFEARRLW